MLCKLKMDCRKITSIIRLRKAELHLSGEGIFKICFCANIEFSGAFLYNRNVRLRSADIFNLDKILHKIIYQEI